jgi:L-seryl-tRNA(Ser) seleniumtransferase
MLVFSVLVMRSVKLSAVPNYFFGGKVAFDVKTSQATGEPFRRLWRLDYPRFAMGASHLRHLPSIDALLRRESFQDLAAQIGREALRNRLREVLTQLRHELSSASNNGLPPESLMTEIERRVHDDLARRSLSLTRRVINATGVVIHTNLGRAPLSHGALAAINEVAGGYCNLEFDLASGERGRRGAGLEAMLRELCGSEAAAVVNNCAAAVLIALDTLAAGGEVIVSRGELIEIGGSFRIPEVIAKSGARLREVGTTNRTRLSDYEAAINSETRAILRAHPSNYRIIGFTERPSLEELATLARRHHLPFFEDLGSGAMIDLTPLGIPGEPTVATSLQAGVSVVAFSGDKLLGGPQAGLLLGEERFISQIKRNPLMRALRVDKLTYAALEATITAYAAGRARDEIPVQAGLSASKEEIARRARNFLRRARKFGEKVRLSLIDGASAVGGGSAPGIELATKLIAVEINGLSARELEEKLRASQPPVIARIVDDQLLIDLRTVAPSDEADLLAAIERLVGLIR